MTNAPAHKSLVAQQGLCNCEFVQLNHPAYSPDLAPSNYFLIRNLKYRLRETWFIDSDSLKIAVKAWSESQNRKLYFQGINRWEQKLKICIDVAWEYLKKWQHVWYSMLTFNSQVSKLFDRPSCAHKCVCTSWCIYILSVYISGRSNCWTGTHSSNHVNLKPVVSLTSASVSHLSLH